MDYVLGVDGDNGYTAYYLFTTAGDCVGSLRDSTCSQEVVGFEGAVGILRARIFQLLRQAHVAPGQLAAAAFGLAGVDTQRQREQFEACFLSQAVAPQCGVTGDVFLGVLGCTSRGVGVCSLNASGCATGAIDSRGVWRQVGGQGFMTGDDSGGGYLVEACLRKVYDAHFRCGEETVMSDPVLSLLRVASPDDLVDAIIENDHLDERALARIVFTAAELDDGPALDILRHVGREMAKSTAGCLRPLAFDGPVELVLAGGTWRKAENRLLHDFYEKELRTLCPRVPLRIVYQQAPLATGAVLWALRMMGVDPYAPALREKIVRQITERSVGDTGDGYER